MKLLSDFDGVWTLPDDEAAAQGAWIEHALLDWCGAESAHAVAGWLAGARAAVAAEPRRYGWAPGGRLSAFGDEDPFTRSSGLLHHVHLRAEADPVAAGILGAIEAHGFSLETFGAHAHAEGVKQVERERGPGVTAEAAAAARAMLAAGTEIVVVSNSGADKLGRWLEAAGLPHVVHPERRAGAAALRGSARKFMLDRERSAPLDVGGVTIETARPKYEAILREERPEAVVGDVFSLDLALPLSLRRNEAEFAALRLFWLVRRYTPAWLRRAVETAAPEVEFVEDGLSGAARRLGVAPQRVS
jgi:hypothetical protein